MSPFRVRRALLGVALLVLAGLVLVAVRAVGVVRRYDEALAAPVFTHSPGCANDALARLPTTGANWRGAGFEERDAVVTGERTVAEALPAAARADLEACRAANAALLRCELDPFEQLDLVALSTALVMVPVEVRWEFERGDAAAAATTCVQAVRFALQLSQGSGVADASSFLFELEDACRAPLDASPAQRAELEALELPPADGMLRQSAAMRLQLAVDRRTPPDWRTQLGRWWQFSRDEAARRALSRQADTPGPARDAALDAVEGDVSDVRVLIELRDGVAESLRTLQRRPVTPAETR